MDKKSLTDEAIADIIDSKVKDAIAWPNAKLSKERERVTRFYNGELPAPQHKGSSSFVSTEVYDGVESMKAQLLEVFAGGADIVRFDPQNSQDIAACTQATEYTKYVVFRQNNGYEIFNDAIHDGLTARVGIAKVWWEKEVTYDEREFSGASEDDVQSLADSEEISDLEAEQDDDGTWSGKATRKIEGGRVRIEVINPEEFAVEPQAKALSPEWFCVHQTLKTYDDLLKQGYDKSKLDNADSNNDPQELRQRAEVLARFQQIDSGVKFDDDGTQDETRWMLVNECYSKFQRKGDKHAKLYKIVRIGNQTMEIEEIDKLPFIAWRPLPIPHSFYGNNFGARIIPHQNSRTALIRSIIDHAMITNNPRWNVLKGGLTNPRELLDNRLGGIVNTTRPDAVTPLPQAQMNPYVYQTLELLKSQNEETTGISSLSQGLNKDAVSNQNSQGMVNDLVNMSQTRQKVIARQFANEFIIPLWLMVYDLVLLNEKQQSIVELSGGFTEIDPRLWIERKSASVSLHLGYGEMDREAQKRLSMFALWTQDPQLGSLFTLPNRYKAACDVAKMQGITNVNDYLTPPNQVPPPKPDPMKLQEMQIEQTKAQAAMLTAQASMKKVDMHGAIEKMKAQLTKMQQDFDNSIKAKDEQRKDADTMNKIDVAQREIKLAETNPIGQEQVIVSPH